HHRPAHTDLPTRRKRHARTTKTPYRDPAHRPGRDRQPPRSDRQRPTPPVLRNRRRHPHQHPPRQPHRRDPQVPHCQKEGSHPLTTTIDEPPRLIRVEDAARLLNIGRPAVYDLIRSRRLRTVKIGARRLIPREAIDEVIALLLDEEPE